MLIPIGKAVYCLFRAAQFNASALYSLCSIRILVLRCLDILVIQQKGDLLSFEYVLRLAFIVVSCIL